MVKKSTGQESINQIGLSKLFNINEEKIPTEHKKTENFWNFALKKKQIVGVNGKKTRIKEKIQKAKAEISLYKEFLGDSSVRKLDFKA